MEGEKEMVRKNNYEEKQRDNWENNIIVITQT